MAACVRNLTGFLIAVLVVNHGGAAAATSADSILLQIIGSQYTGLVRLLEEANLLTHLENEGYFASGITIFAPSDHYLENKVSPTLLSFLSQPANTGYLRRVLLNHIVLRKVTAESWFHGQTVKTLAGEDAKLYMDGNDLKVEGVVVKELAVLEAGDGVVHAINGFLVPSDVVEAANAAEEAERRELVGVTAVQLQSASAPAPSPPSDLTQLLVDALNVTGNYNALLDLLISLNLLPTLSDILESGQALTLAAPDDTAFSGLVRLGSLNQTQVTSILLYHVIVGAYTYDELAAVGNGTSLTSSRRLLQQVSGTVNTLINATLTVRTFSAVNGMPTVYLSDGLIMAQDLLNGTDLLALHGIDAVLIPPTITLPPAITLEPPSSPPPALFPPPIFPPPPSAGNRLAVWSSAALTMAALAVAALTL